MAIFAGGILAALLLAGLRNEIQRLRYERAAHVREVRALEEELRERTVRVRALRDPMRLSRLARQKGFRRPEAVIDLSSQTRVALGPRTP